jgi:hypothetical protein
LAFLEDLVAMTDAAGVHFDEHLPQTRFGDGTLDEFKGTARAGELCDNHGIPSVGIFGHKKPEFIPVLA